MKHREYRKRWTTTTNGNRGIENVIPYVHDQRSSDTFAGPDPFHFIEIQSDEHRRRTVSTGQLVEFTLQPEPGCRK